PAERTAVVARARDRRKDRRGRWVQRHRARPAGSARDRAARYRGRRVAPWAPYRALDEGGDARADPRRAAAVTVHPDRKCECQRADARDQHEARLPPRLAGDPLADSADKSPRRRARTRRVSLTVVRCGPGGGLPAPCPYALSPLRPASLRIRSARSMPRSDFAIALPSAAVRATVSVSFDAPLGSTTGRLLMFPSGAAASRTIGGTSGSVCSSTAASSNLRYASARSSFAR